MRYIIACDSDAGKVKKENQDALAVRHALLANGEAVLAVLCDGMGGYEHGEIASSSLVMAYVDWFENMFLRQYEIMSEEDIRNAWEKILINMNKKIYEYGKSNSIRIGTTLTLTLVWNGRYYIMNVGDCRAYEFSVQARQITKDHSFVAQEIEAGRMTVEEARVHSRRNELSQCVGGNIKTSGDFYTGSIIPEAVYMMCCDGVRTKVNDEELFYFLHPLCMENEEIMNNNIKYIFELNKSRNETDNMSIILIKDTVATMQLAYEDRKAKLQYSKTIVSSKTII